MEGCTRDKGLKIKDAQEPYIKTWCKTQAVRRTWEKLECGTRISKPQEYRETSAPHEILLRELSSLASWYSIVKINEE